MVEQATPRISFHVRQERDWSSSRRVDTGSWSWSEIDMVAGPAADEFPLRPVMVQETGQSRGLPTQGFRSSGTSTHLSNLLPLGNHSSLMPCFRHLEADRAQSRSLKVVSADFDSARPVSGCQESSRLKGSSSFTSSFNFDHPLTSINKKGTGSTRAFHSPNFGIVNPSLPFEVIDDTLDLILKHRHSSDVTVSNQEDQQKRNGCINMASVRVIDRKDKIGRK